MICYIDSSAVLRSLFDQEGQFLGWHKVESGISSVLLRVECCRTIDRMRLAGAISDEELANIKLNLSLFLRGLTIYKIDDAILRLASEPFSTMIGTLDAIHLSTALLWSEEHNEPIHLISFDHQLRTASLSLGINVLP